MIIFLKGQNDYMNNIVKKYFDDYFDQVYFINLKERKDRLENILGLFKTLNINNFKRIEAIKCTKKEHNNYIQTCKNMGYRQCMSMSQYSCKLSHVSCMEDAVKNSYKRILIFEDDAVLLDGLKNDLGLLDKYLNICFNFLSKNDWDVFYFDNCKGSGGRRRGPNSMQKTPSQIKLHQNDNNIVKIKRKLVTLSYAINCKNIQKIIKFQNEHKNVPNDRCLSKQQNIKKYFFSNGMFTQLSGILSDNVYTKIKIADNDKPQPLDPKYKLGEYIGSGACRKVYNHPTDDTLVIKVLKKKWPQNQREWDVWQMVKGTEYEQFFCPCVEISNDGKYLIQKKAKKSILKFTHPIIKGRDTMLTKNAGIYNEQVVLIDYGDSGILKCMEKILK